MRPGSEQARHSAAGREAGTYDTVLIFRLVGASVLFAVSLIIDKLPDFVGVLLLILSAAVAGYDVLIDAFSCVSERDFFATPVIVAAVTVVSYMIGFGAEGAALMILYQIGLLLIAYAEERTRRSALELLQYQDEATVDHITQLILRDGAGSMSIEGVIGYNAGKVLKYAMIFSVVYAIALPLITNYSLRVSVHRAMAIILIATPMSVVISMPLTGIIGMCFSARHGVVFDSAALMETTADADVAVFDNAGVFCSINPKLASVQSDILDDSTFVTFAAHALYYSDQPVARAVAAVYTSDYQLQLVKNFADIPGYGVEADIGGAHVVLANRELFVGRGVALPADKDGNGQSFFMTVGGRYVGRLTINSQYNDEADGLAMSMKEAGVPRCVLLTEDGNTESRRIAEETDFSEVYGECDTAKKLSIVSELKNSTKGAVLFVYATGVEAHSDADVDIRVSKRGKYADVLITPEYLANLPFAVQICRRMREIAIENAVFAFVVKTILVFLSIIGYCNIWFAIFIDMVAAVATILNSIRVTSESLISAFMYKTGQR